MFLCTGAETADGLLLDLTDTLTGETELIADFLKGHLAATDTEEHTDDILLTVCKS